MEILAKKKYIISLLQTLLEHNLYASNQVIFDRAYRNRFIGFRSELDFILDFNNLTLLDGGYILPMQDRNKTLSAPLYFTISNKEPSSFDKIYKNLSNFSFAKMLFLQYADLNFSNWEKVDVMETGHLFPVPRITTFEMVNSGFIDTSKGLDYLTNHFLNKKRSPKRFSIDDRVRVECENMLIDFDLDLLVKIYVERLVFDGYIGFSKYKGIPSDIDMIRYKPDKDSFFLLEIKEKDLSRSPPQGFGIDVRRLIDLLKLQKQTRTKFVYVVRKVNNQEDRVKQGWYYITINDFYEHTKDNAYINGGAGMASVTSNHDTVVCDFKYFTEIPS